MAETTEEAALRRAHDTARHKRNREIRLLNETAEQVAIRRARQTEASRLRRTKRLAVETEVEAALRRARETETRLKYRDRLKKRTAKLKLLLTPSNTVDVFKNVDPCEITEYKKLFPNLEKIADRPIHCTSCNLHIGTALINEALIKIHPLLRVIQCQECYVFYMSRKFELGDDECEIYCRWCGQGVELYCCSNCPKVYCRRCIEQNLSNGMWSEIQNNKDWICFACDSACLLQLKADYWALLNFIEERKKSITNKQLTHTGLYLEMTKDCSQCCLKIIKIPIRKRKLPKIYGTPPAKRNMIDRAENNKPFALEEVTKPRFDKPPPNGRLVRDLEIAQTVQPASQTGQQNIGHGKLVLVRKQQPMLPNASKGLASGCTSLLQPIIPKSTETQRTEITTPRKPPSLLAGKSKYEILVKNSIEVCKQFTGKVKKLANSKMSTCAKTQTDFKDLIISLFYLLKNASTLFQNIQDTCDDNLKIMGFGSDNLKSDDDDIEIFESISPLIELD